ncbi:MAG: enoyl-CoA hydratase/isomerase family protein [Sulfolobaceae archaeon]|nr:enoyl-CoA hydratase/isomerase family protein [Sulfolobales archaeon]
MPLVTYNVQGDVGFIVMDTGTRYNLVNGKFMLEFLDILDVLNKNQQIRFITVHGAKDNFGAGADINELFNATNSREHADWFFNTMKEIYVRLMTSDKFIIGFVRGVAYGAHLELLLAMDYVIANKDAKFAAPGGRIGVLPPVLVTMGPERIGWNATRRLAFLGETLDAGEALRIGLVDEVTEETEPMRAVDKVVRAVRQMAPTSVTRMRKILYARYGDLIERAFQSLKEQLMTLDARDGVTAFLTKTKPPWVKEG